MAASCAGLASLTILAALGCAAAALWIFALPALGPVGAPLAVAAALVAATASLATVAWLLMRDSRQGLQGQPLLTEALRLFSEHKGAVLLAAVVAGMATADSSRKP